MSPTQIVEALFTAFVDGDGQSVRTLCDAELCVPQNHESPMPFKQLLVFSGSVQRIVPDYHYSEVVRRETRTEFVEEHSVRGTLPDGSELRLAACVVGDICDGKLTELREHVDSLAARDLAAALAG